MSESNLLPDPVDERPETIIARLRAAIAGFEDQDDEWFGWSVADTKAVMACIQRLSDASQRISGNPLCGGCGGPHPFDTSVPSVLWNAVVRPLGGSEYLCSTCIIRAFATAGVSFTAELYGDDFHGLPIEVRINGEDAQAAAKIQDENNALRWKLSEQQAERDEAIAERKETQAEFQHLNEVLSTETSAALQRAEQAEQRCATLRAALEKIRDEDPDCQCEHDTEDCCNFQGSGFCARCIAHSALTSITNEARAALSAATGEDR